MREKTKAMSPLETIPHFRRDVGGTGDFLNEGEVPQLCVLEVKVLCVKGGLMIISSFRCHGSSLKKNKKNFLHRLFFICRNRRIEFLFKFI